MCTLLYTWCTDTFHQLNHNGLPVRVELELLEVQNLVRDRGQILFLLWFLLGYYYLRRLHDHLSYFEYGGPQQLYNIPAGILDQSRLPEILPSVLCIFLRGP